jgi:hypothetical protein
MKVRRDMAWAAAEINDRPRGSAADHLSKGGEQAALNRPVIQCVLELVSVQGCDCIVGRAGTVQIGLRHGQDNTRPPRHARPLHAERPRIRRRGVLPFTANDHAGVEGPIVLYDRPTGEGDRGIYRGQDQLNKRRIDDMLNGYTRREPKPPLAEYDEDQPEQPESDG